MKNTLIVAAHPDDIEVNMAHLIGERLRSGSNVIAYVATDGEASTINLRQERFCRRTAA